MKYVRIPKERIGVVIGKDGETKKAIEKFSRIPLEIDSEEGEVVFNELEAQDPLMPLKLEDIIRAIGRGFSPEHAFRLFGEETELFIFDIYDYVSKKESHLTRVKSRVIGREGKTKRVIESLTGGTIAVYGHTVAVIADFDSMDIAKKAIDMLLSGSEHPTVYRFLEREMKKLHLGRRLHDL
ncbi:MAG: RNA-processing protein [Candidatus Thermoplasmatota archaeon]|nr:RNA-processing protein [Candidatus Thermoplasmatota archaeon]